MKPLFLRHFMVVLKSSVGINHVVSKIKYIILISKRALYLERDYSIKNTLNSEET